jgi:hypothetical protein
MRGGVAGSQLMSTAVHRSPNKLWRSNSIFNLWLAPADHQWAVKIILHKQLSDPNYLLYISCLCQGLRRKTADSILNPAVSLSLAIVTDTYIQLFITYCTSYIYIRLSPHNISIHCKDKMPKFETNIPRKGISGPQSQCPHSCVCERIILYIPTMGLSVLLEEICRLILGIYKSLKDT